MISKELNVPVNFNLLLHFIFKCSLNAYYIWTDDISTLSLYFLLYVLLTEFG